MYAAWPIAARMSDIAVLLFSCDCSLMGSKYESPGQNSLGHWQCLVPKLRCGRALTDLAGCKHLQGSRASKRVIIQTMDILLW